MGLVVPIASHPRFERVLDVGRLGSGRYWCRRCGHQWDEPGAVVHECERCAPAPVPLDLSDNAPEGRTT